MQNFKLFFAALVFSGTFVACQNQEKAADTFHINGEITGANDAKMFLKYRGDSGWQSMDSANVVDGKFSMTGHVDDVTLVYLVSDAFRGGIPILLGNEDLNITMDKDSLQNAKVTGSPVQEIYDQAKADIENFDKGWQSYYYETFRFLPDEEKAAKESYLDHLYDSTQMAKKDFLNTFLVENKGNIASAQIILDQEDALGNDAMISLFEQLDEPVKMSGPGKSLSDRVDIIKRTSVGQPLIDFTMNDTTGAAVSLAEFSQGKYTLVDFWAAWCGPCRRENPNVVANYTKYHDKGFDVFGVSFDDSKEKWVKAINDDGLMWMQVSDLKGWDNAAGKLYGIHSIPQNILLSPDGNIIAKNLRGDDLSNKLKEIFGE